MSSDLNSLPPSDPEAPPSSLAAPVALRFGPGGESCNMVLLPVPVRVFFPITAVSNGAPLNLSPECVEQEQLIALSFQMAD